MLRPTQDRTWTYADYCGWPDDERWELIDGVAYAMVPAPMRLHQEIVSDLHYLLRRQLEGRPCHVYPSPFDVRLPERGEADDLIDTVVQPDISVFGSEEHLDAKGARGAPDLVIEVLSPSTSARDMIIKRALYERHGVSEYWIVDGESRTQYRFVMEQGRFREPDVLSYGDRLEVRVLEGVVIEMDSLFSAPPPAQVPGESSAGSEL